MVGGDARPETAINALLDLLAWQWQMTVEREKPGRQRAGSRVRIEQACRHLGGLSHQLVERPA